ncbi:YdbH family protein [Testudinibacter sp. TR-2022]|uniref:YdbH family protein n=1 Tax=Testudinibacter sp. TR-2022 TaxID=2585029 RepID=UPI0011183C58|nr:YdbH family protein [Testudinibacter sp. TR-2022]TNH03402.1 YdbH family protein [Pasteurellaceae bacterium Phil31]TNH07614.1 YdbH family protein [Testudinibacter sp. TR-2022]TNH09838.1 YdbH family protein [Testudinibacter sp. TR-2022]TNH16445.1 YdbH family protein [Testudinibacter sp. TR-2022]TNH16950.1 YdbH family protein [Testudinibacter sp. TR-2022]
MWKKCLIACCALLLLLSAMVAWLLFGNGIQKTANYFLAPDFQIQLNQPLRIDRQAISLPEIQLTSLKHGCRLTETAPIRFIWQQRRLFSEQVRLDYRCLQQMIAQEATTTEQPPFTLTRLFALLPLGEVEIADVEWQNSQAERSPQLQRLLAASTHLKAVRQDDQLRLQLHITEHQEGQVYELANLDGILVDKTLTALLVYQPDEQQHHQVTLNADLADSVEQLPLRADLDYHWRSPDMIIPQGGITLNWKQQQAQLQLYEVADQEQHQLLDLPFDIKNGRLHISKARFNWAKQLPQPLNGFLDLDLQPTAQNHAFWNSFPLNINFRLSLLTNGDKGKGQVVIQGLDGKIDRQSLDIPLQVNGEVKSFDSIFYTNLPMRLEGELYRPLLRFLSGSLLRMTGNTEYIDIEELRLPLAGVVVGQYGIKGRLQAILKGKTRQFEQIDLRLDGRANEFIAGIHSIFNIRSAQEVVRLSETSATNRWNWNFWGNAKIPSLKSAVNLRGRGFWQDSLLNIQLLDGDLQRFALPGVQVGALQLSLSQNLLWDYQQQQISGALSVKTPHIRLDYGGQILQPDISVTLDGKDFSDLNLKSELRADRLGPIRLFSRYQDGTLRGNIYWPQQSSDVFQPLFPKRWNWLIQRGTIRGQTAFSITPQNGLVAGGHIAIENGSISLPNGAISGINFSLPYRYQDQHFQLGVKQPVEVKIAQLDNGVRLNDVSLQLQGYYPYNRQSPLSLTRLNLKLLGGELNVDKFSLPQRNPAYLRLNGIELAEILQLMQYNQLEMRGKVNAKLPFWIENSDCIICDGVIEQGNDWRIHLSDELIRKIEQGGGITERILTNLMETMDVYDSNIKVNLLTDGTGLMNAKIKANNALQNPIFLNYNHKENAFDLWDSINFGSELQQQLEYRLYQKQNQDNQNQ